MHREFTGGMRTAFGGIWKRHRCPKLASKGDISNLGDRHMELLK